MTYQARIPDKLCKAISQLRRELNPKMGKDTPTLQDFVLVALDRLIEQLEEDEEQAIAIAERLKRSRKSALNKMGNKIKAVAQKL